MPHPNHCQPVAGIDPVEGWILCTGPEDDGDGFTTPAYYAVKGEACVALGVSRFNFDPTQARFEWLVRADFPLATLYHNGAVGPLTNAHIDTAIAAAALSEAA